MKSRSPFQIWPPSKRVQQAGAADEQVAEDDQRQPERARSGVMRSRSTSAASSVVHSGRLPGSSTEACDWPARRRSRYRPAGRRPGRRKTPASAVTRSASGEAEQRVAGRGWRRRGAALTSQAPQGTSTRLAPQMRAKARSKGVSERPAEARAMTMKRGPHQHRDHGRADAQMARGEARKKRAAAGIRGLSRPGGDLRRRPRGHAARDNGPMPSPRRPGPPLRALLAAWPFVLALRRRRSAVLAQRPAARGRAPRWPAPRCRATR